MFTVIEPYMIGIIKCLCGKILLGNFFERRLKSRVADLALIVYFGLIIMLNSVFSGVQPLLAIGETVIYSVLYGVIYKEKLHKIIIASAAYVILSLCVELPFYLFIQFFAAESGTDIIQAEPSISAAINLAVEMLVLIVIVIISRIFGKKGYLHHLKATEWLSLLCISAVSASLIFVLIFKGVEYFAVLAAAVLVLANVIAYSYISERGMYNEQKQELALLDEHNRTMLESFMEVGSLYEEQRLKIHEFKTQINVIDGLVSHEDYDELREYLSGIKTNVQEVGNYVETGNQILNVLLNQSIKKARDRRIAIAPDVRILLKIRIDDNDLVIIVSNLLNNAIEYCMTLENSSKVIHFRLESTSMGLLIICTNPIEHSVTVADNLIQTSKSDTSHHGLGLKNIKRSVERYGGKIDISTDENVFRYVVQL